MLFVSVLNKAVRLSYGGLVYQLFRLAMLLALIGVLAGCASLPNTKDAGVSTAVEAGQAPFFVLKGRISVRVGQRLETGSIVWTRTGQEERLEIFTPLGSQIAEILKTASSGVVMRKGNESISAGSIGELTAELLGVALDLDLIAAWTQGIGLTDGQTQSVSLPGGEIWQVTAERFQPSGNHRFASRLSATQADTVVRLVIDEWQAR